MAGIGKSLVGIKNGHFVLSFGQHTCMHKICIIYSAIQSTVWKVVSSLLGEPISVVCGVEGIAEVTKLRTQTVTSQSRQWVRWLLFGCQYSSVLIFLSSARGRVITTTQMVGWICISWFLESKITMITQTCSWFFRRWTLIKNDADRPNIYTETERDQFGISKGANWYLKH